MIRYVIGLTLLIQLLGVTMLSLPIRAQDVCSTPYTVQRGDTFGGIAAQCGLTQAALRTANPQVTNPNLIRVGQQLNIPTDEESCGIFTGGLEINSLRDHVLKELELSIPDPTKFDFKVVALNTPDTPPVLIQSWGTLSAAPDSIQSHSIAAFDFDPKTSCWKAITRTWLSEEISELGDITVTAQDDGQFNLSASVSPSTGDTFHLYTFDGKEITLLLASAGETMVDSSVVAAANGYADSSAIERSPCSDLTAAMFVPTPFHLRHFAKCGKLTAAITADILGIAEEIVLPEDNFSIHEQTIEILRRTQGTGQPDLVLALSSDRIAVPAQIENSAGIIRQYVAILTLQAFMDGLANQSHVMAFSFDGEQWQFYGHQSFSTSLLLPHFQTVHTPEGSWLVVYNSLSANIFGVEEAAWLSLNMERLQASSLYHPVTIAAAPSRPAGYALDVATTPAYRQDEQGLVLQLNFRIDYRFDPYNEIDLPVERQAQYRWNARENQFELLPERSTVEQAVIDSRFYLPATDFLKFAEEELYTLARTGTREQLERLRTYLLGLEESAEQQALLQSLP